MKRRFQRGVLNPNRCTVTEKKITSSESSHGLFNFRHESGTCHSEDDIKQLALLISLVGLDSPTSYLTLKTTLTPFQYNVFL